MGGGYLSTPKTEKLSTSGSNDTLRFAASEMQGWRTEMEDAHINDPQFDKGISLFAVFDGHGGDEVAKYVGKNYGPLLKSLSAYKSKDYKAALRESFFAIDR